MISYSITKYKKIDSTIYNDWISVHDIGKVYNGKVLTFEDYKKVEDSYVLAVLNVLDYISIKRVYVKNLFSYMDLRNSYSTNVLNKPCSNALYTNEMKDFYLNVKNNDIIDLFQLEHLIRFKLREDIGGEIFVPYRFKLFIGYDYLMSVRTSKSLEGLFKTIEKLGLYIYALST